MNEYEMLLSLTALALAVVGLVNTLVGYIIQSPEHTVVSVGYGSAGLSIAVALAAHRVAAWVGIEASIANHE